MNYLTVQEVSEKWHISTRRICVLCNQQKIPGAVKRSKVWMIPDNAQKPEDARKGNIHSEKRTVLHPAVLLLNPTYFEYNTSVLPTKDEKTLCEIQDWFLGGEVEKAYGALVNLMRQADTRYSFVLNVLKIIYSTDMGEKDELSQSRKSLDNLFACEGFDFERRLLSFYFKENINSSTYAIENELMYREMMPLISFICARKSINNAFKTASFIDCSSLEIICKELEEKDSPLLLAYYHIFLAVYYNTAGVEKLYDIHINKAVQILLPRKWYMPIAEYSATLDLEFIKDIDEKAYSIITVLSRKIVGNYVKTGLFKEFQNAPHMDHAINVQICYKIALGKSNEEIAEELGISQYKVRKQIDELISYTGSKNRKDLKQIFTSNLFL